MRLQEYLAIIGIILVVLLASIVNADLYEYNLQANLTEDKVVYIEQEPHYYDLFYINSDNTALLTFLNYNANLGSSNISYDYNDPYLYLYEKESTVFGSINNFSDSYSLINEDDDGNTDEGEGLYFYLEDIALNSQIVALITSYDPMVTGTVDFTIYSNEELVIIPEPQAIGLIFLGASTLLIFRKRT